MNPIQSNPSSPIRQTPAAPKKGRGATETDPRISALQREKARLSTTLRQNPPQKNLTATLRQVKDIDSAIKILATPASDIKKYTQEDIRKLTGAQIKALTEEQLGTFSLAQVKAFTPEQFKEFNVNQISYFTASPETLSYAAFSYSLHSEETNAPADGPNEPTTIPLNGPELLSIFKQDLARTHYFVQNTYYRSSKDQSSMECYNALCKLAKGNDGFTTSAMCLLNQSTQALLDQKANLKMVENARYTPRYASHSIEVENNQVILTIRLGTQMKVFDQASESRYIDNCRCVETTLKVPFEDFCNKDLSRATFNDKIKDGSNLENLKRSLKWPELKD